MVRAVWPEDDPEWVENDVRDLLARFGLRGELAFQTVGQLSGGEKAKAALARLCATSANLLVMDEPTNHLDIWSRESLERSINEFEGTVLVVSHDRYFLNQVVDRLVAMADGQARVIEGDYDTFQHMIQKEKGTLGGSQGQPRRLPHKSPLMIQGRARAKARAEKKPSENTPTARPPRSSARSASSKQSSPSSKTSSASPQPGATRSRRSVHRNGIAISRFKLETLYEHWETALEANW